MLTAGFLGNPFRQRLRPRQVELVRDPDAALVDACRRPDSDGFHDAFEALFERYRERVYAIAFRVSGNASDALDIVQESFALLFRKIGTFQGTSLFSTWLFRIVTNCSIDYRRRRKVGKSPSLLTDHGEHVEAEDDAQGPRDTAIVHEVGDHVQEAISKLSPKLRVILALRYLEEMSYEQLATTLDISLGTVKSRLARAHVALEHTVRTQFPHLGVSQQLAAEDAARDAGKDHDPDRQGPVGGVG